MGKVDYTILITSPDASTTLIDPIGAGDRYGRYGWRAIALSPRFNQVGSGNFTTSATPDVLAAVNTPENRVVVIREPADGDSVIEMSGPIERQPFGYKAERDGTDGPGTVTVWFADDLARIAKRLVYPNPAQASTAQTVAKYTISAVNAEDAMRALVNLNAGPGALTARRVPGLVLGADNGLGTTVSTSFTRATHLTDALREVARLGGGLGFRTQQVGTQIQFQVYAPRDLTDTVWFSRDLGNIRDVDYEPEAPKATVAIVGDAAAGTGRVIKERTNTAALAAGWFRSEAFVDARSAANATELDQAGDEHLADSGPSARLNLVAVETPSQRYRDHFAVGDSVTCEVFDGYRVVDIVRGVDITVSAEKGETVVPIIGAQGDALADAKAAELDKLRKRITQIEGAL